MTLKQDPNDKYKEFEVDFHANETLDEEEKNQHKDKLLEFFCDTHPSAPQCKVYDDWCYQKLNTIHLKRPTSFCVTW